MANGIATDEPSEFATGVLATSKGMKMGAAIDTDGYPMPPLVVGKMTIALHAGHDIHEVKVKDGTATESLLLL